MRAVTKALGAILAAAALAAAARVAATAATASRGPGRSRHVGPATPGRASTTGPTAGRRPSPATARTTSPSSGHLRRLHRHGRELGAHGRAARPATSSPGQRPTARQANTNYTKYHARHRHRRLLVHGRPRRRPALERHHDGGLPSGARGRRRDALAAMKSCKRHLPGGVGRHRAAGDRAGARQRLEQRLLLALQRARCRRPPSPATVDRAEFNGFANYITAHSTYKVGVYSSAPVWTSIFGTGSYAQHPEHLRVDLPARDLDGRCRRPRRPAGACTARRRARSSSAGRPASSKYALMWQWSGGGGIINRYGPTSTRSTSRG